MLRINARLFVIFDMSHVAFYYLLSEVFGEGR